jgi:hypothetical protein
MRNVASTAKPNTHPTGANANGQPVPLSLDAEPCDDTGGLPETGKAHRISDRLLEFLESVQYEWPAHLHPNGDRSKARVNELPMSIRFCFFAFLLKEHEIWLLNQEIGAGVRK